MNKLLKIVTVVTTLALVLGATFACGFSASAALTETVLFDGDVTWSGTPAGKAYMALVQIDDITQALRDYAASNTPISGDEYFKFVCTGTTENYITPGFYQETGGEYIEAWAVEENGYYKMPPKTVDKKGNIHTGGADIGSGVQFAIFNDADDAEVDPSVTLTHVYISVFRNGGSSTSTVSEDTSSTVSEDTSSTVSEDTSSTVESSTIDAPAIGDANSDGVIDMKDILLVRKVVASFTGLTYDKTAADYNGDGTIDLKDVLAIRKAVAA